MLAKITCFFGLILLAVLGYSVDRPSPSMGALPFVFLENKGQVLDQRGEPNPEVLFLTQQLGVKVYITSHGLGYQFERHLTIPKTPDNSTNSRRPESDSVQVTTYRVAMNLIGANPNPVVVAEEPNTYYENYYNIPSAPEGIVSVHSYQRIVVRDVYPQIDWVIYSQAGAMKYDFVVRRGGDARMIRMQWDGALAMELTEKGGILVRSPLGEITEAAPISFVGNNQKEIGSAYILDGNVVRFAIDAYDRSESLRIDPALEWATYYGGNGLENAYGVAADSVGNSYLAGYSTSTSSISMGGFQNTFSGQQDGYLVKFDPAGVRVWATYYGGSGSDHAQAVAIDPSGSNIYITGNTASSTGIAFAGHQMTRGGGISPDAFLVKFTSTGLRTWGTYYGAIGADDGIGVAANATNVFLVGTTTSTSAIAVGGAQNSYGGGNADAFLAKFDAAGTRLWGTYCGGPAEDQGYHVCVDPVGNTYLAGTTFSSSGISLNGFQSTYAGNEDGFLVKYDVAGAKAWGTYYGGSAVDEGTGVAADTSGNVYLVGHTRSTSGIAFNGFLNSITGGLAAYLVKFSSNGARLWGTYFWHDVYAPYSAEAVICDRFGNPIIIGMENGHYAVVNSQPNPSWGDTDNYYFKYSPSGIPISQQFFGGNDTEVAWGIAADKLGNFFICGGTSSDSGMTFNGHQMVYGGGTSSDGYLMKFVDTCTNTSQAPTAVCQNITIAISGSSVNYVGDLVAAGSTTLCGGYLVRTATPNTLTCADIGVHNVTVQVFQPSTGLSSACSATVTVLDTLPPQITCPTNQVATAPLGQCSVVVNYTSPTAIDNCVTPTIVRTTGLASGASFPGGVTTTTYVATANGATDTCSFTVTVNDIQAPQITCPQNISGSTTIFSNCTYVANYATPMGTDNCGGAITSQTMGMSSGDAFPAGVTTNTFVVTDISGNTASCSFNVTVVDAQSPTLACPPNVYSTGSQGVCGGIVTFNSPVSTDNCPGAIITQNTGNPSGSVFLLGTTTNLYTVTDISGNTGTCSFTITVTDGVPPNITCPANIVQNSAPGTCYATISFPSPVATDNCTNVTTAHLSGPNSGSIFHIGITNEVYRATDAAGNSSTCSFTITVNPNNNVTQTINLCAGRSLVVGHSTYTLPGTYVDSLVASAGGCDSVVTTILTFEPPINTNVTVTNPTISADLGGAVYRWLDCNNGMSGIQGASGQTYAPTANGSYAVIVIVGNCSDTSACANVIVVGTEESSLHSLNGYPNPNGGQFKIDFGAIIADGSLAVYDGGGRKVYQQNLISTGSVELNLPFLSQGVYAVTISDGTTQKVIKMVKL
ncbi:MAG: HYR domain-containing protein [Bacteroidia bacterium]